VFYPENLTMHLGDLARIHFYKKEYEKSFSLCKRAISFEIKLGAVNTIRHYSNLVILHASSIELGIYELAPDLKERISKFSEFSFVKYPVIPKIVEDLKLLNNAKYNFGNVRNTVNSMLQELGINSEKIRLHCYQLIGSHAYQYPWYFIEEDLEKENNETILIFTYGSLLNEESALKSLSPKIVKESKRAIAFGIKRIFNYFMPDEVAERSLYATEINPNEFSVLNAEFTGLPYDFCNGLIMNVPAAEIANLRKREIGYDLVQTSCIYWDDKEWETRPVFVLSCEHKLFKGKWLTKSDLPPHPNYLQTCLKGAQSLGDDFYEFWCRTTYQGNGKDVIKI
jgi:cation transport regulator ChaC